MQVEHHWHTLLLTVWADLEAFAEMRRVRLKSVAGFLDVLLFPGTLCLLLFRLSSVVHHSRLRPLSRLLYILNVMLFGADLAPGATVGPGLIILHPVGMAVAPQVKVGSRARLFGGVGLGEGLSAKGSRDGFPVIGDDCWLYNDAKVLGPVHIGDNAVVGANALVLSSVPAGAIVVGNPARILRYREGFEPHADQKSDEDESSTQVDNAESPIAARTR